MKSGSEHLQYRPVHAPRDDRSALVEPPFAEVPGRVAENLLRRGRNILCQPGLQWQGVPWAGQLAQPQTTIKGHIELTQKIRLVRRAQGLGPAWRQGPDDGTQIGLMQW